jgi:hypothetical protein
MYAGLTRNAYKPVEDAARQFALAGLLTKDPGQPWVFLFA